MLLLRRKQNESIVLDTKPAPTRIVVLAIEGQSVLLGIDAPPEIEITRPDMLNHEPPPHRAGDGQGAFQ